MSLKDDADWIKDVISTSKLAYDARKSSGVDFGTVECQVCMNLAYFRFVGKKKHIRLACQTSGCVRMMS